MTKVQRSVAATATACLFVFLLLFLATRGGEAAVVEARRTCQSQSHKFKGRCFSDTNCGSVCHTEGFPGGKCRGFRQRCFCTGPC